MLALCASALTALNHSPNQMKSNMLPSKTGTGRQQVVQSLVALSVSLSLFV